MSSALESTNVHTPRLLLTPWTQQTSTPYSLGNEQARDLAAEFADLLDRALVHDDSGALTLTDAGHALLDQARSQQDHTHRAMLDGIAPDDYVELINLLRQIIERHGGESDLPE